MCLCSLCHQRALAEIRLVHSEKLDGYFKELLYMLNVIGVLGFNVGDNGQVNIITCTSFWMSTY